MADIKDFELFILLSWILILTPGPDLIYVLTKGIANGKKAGVFSAWGVASGILVHTLLAALGLSVILQASAIAFTIVKYAGAAYLVYLGIKTMLSGKKIQLDANKKQVRHRKVFKEGLISNLFNPKIALFFMAFLPQFISTESATDHTIQFLALGFIFAFFGTLFLSALGYFSGHVSHLLRKNDKIMSRIQATSGVILVLLGIRLAFVRQN